MNRCYPESEIKLKLEPCFGQDKCTVSWHADSSLEHYSTIAVYHVSLPINSPPSITAPDNTNTTTSTTTNPTSNNQEGNKKKNKKSKNSNNSNERQNQNQNQNENSETPWKIALRVWPDAEGPTAGKSSKHGNTESLKSISAVAFPLPNQSTYYLLDDFNHHHQHSGLFFIFIYYFNYINCIYFYLLIVLAGSTHRYASTHRVSRKEGHSFQWLQSRCRTVLQQVFLYILFILFFILFFS